MADRGRRLLHRPRHRAGARDPPVRGQRLAAGPGPAAPRRLLARHPPHPPQGGRPGAACHRHRAGDLRGGRARRAQAALGGAARQPQRARLMRRFAELLERLALTPARNGKLTLLDRLSRAPPPTPTAAGGSPRSPATSRSTRSKPAMLRAITVARVDPELFALSYDFVGDLAETVALIWPAPPGPARRPAPSPRSSTRLRAASRREAPQVVERLLDRLDASGRFALLKLVTGGLRVGVSARLAKQALADARRPRRHRDRGALARPRPALRRLFAWLDRQRPAARDAAGTPFRPVMLAHALDEADFARLDPADYRRRVEMGRHPRPGRRRRPRPPALLPHRRRHLRRLPRPPRRARLRRRPRRRAPGPPRRRLDRHLLRPAAAAEPQDRHAGPAPPLPRAPPRLRPPAVGRRRPPPAALRRAPRRARGPRRHARPRPHRPLAAPRPSPAGTSSTALRAAAARPGDRGRDAEAPGQPLRPRPAEGPLVEVEARPAHHRRGADVRPARPRQALGLLFRLHLRRLDRPDGRR